MGCLASEHAAGILNRLQVRVDAAAANDLLDVTGLADIQRAKQVALYGMAPALLLASYRCTQKAALRCWWAGTVIVMLPAFAACRFFTNGRTEKC